MEVKSDSDPFLGRISVKRKIYMEKLISETEHSEVGQQPGLGSWHVGGRGRRRGADAARRGGAGGSGWRRLWPARLGLTGCSGPMLPWRQPRGHTPGFWPGTQTCHQPSPWCSPRTLLPNLTCQVAWSGGQPVPPSPAHDACPGWFLRLSCVSSSGPHIQGLTRP